MSGYAFIHQGQAFTPNGRLPAETDADTHNRETEARELARLKTAPERVFLYVSLPAEYHAQPAAKRFTSYIGYDCAIIHTWPGTVVGTDVRLGRAYTVPAFGGFRSTRRSMSCRIFGVRYVGTYYESAGDYCRLRKAKRQ